MRGLRRKKVAEEIGCSTETLRLWVRRADKDLRQRLPKPAGKRRRARRGSSATADARPGGSQPPAPEEAPTPASGDSSAAKKAPTAPHSPGSGLSEPEVSAILELRKRYPTMGPAQIRAQLKRFKGWRVAIRAIASVLRKHGYELEHRAGRPQEPEPPRSWEAPYRNAIWQIDFTEVRLPEGRRALGVVIDDFSRFLVGYALLCNPSSEDVVAMLQGAIRLHGKPEAIYTDRAGPFLAWGKPEGLQHYLQRELIDHHTTRSYRPQGRGKVEAVIATIKRELWEVEHFDNEEIALQRLRLFVERYNHHRAHLALDGLTPADRFFGRWERVLEAMEAKSRKRQGLELLDDLSSELLPPGQTEVLRLVAIEGKLELRFFGHRVRLGEIES
jgi:transposase InsO family protein